MSRTKSLLLLGGCVALSKHETNRPICWTVLGTIGRGAGFRCGYTAQDWILDKEQLTYLPRYF